MDNNKLPELDELLARVHGSALNSLAAVVDVEQRLQSIHRACAPDQTADMQAALGTSAQP